MGHLASRSYGRLAQRLSQYVPGTNTSTTLCEILKLLVTAEEAELLALLPLREQTAAEIARVWRMSVAEAVTVLESTAGKGVVYAFGGATRPKTYVLAPPVLGFFEFSLMRSDGKLDAAKLAELYHQYCQVEGDFIRQQGEAHPALSRVFAHEEGLDEVSSEVLSEDRVSAGIDAATFITTGQCYCRHKMEHLGKACDAPLDVCLTFNDVARYLASYGIAREISKAEAHRIVRECKDRGLVQIGDNKKSGLAVICNCCGCCCDLLLGYKKFGGSGLVSPSAFQAEVPVAGSCNGCGECLRRCPVDAVTLPGGVARVAPEICLGCGVCARFCPTGALSMTLRPERPFIPEDLVEKLALAAIDVGKLGNFLFDDQTSRGHALLRTAVNRAVRLPPVKKVLLWRPVFDRLLGMARQRAA